jgi:hypothetical protein
MLRTIFAIGLFAVVGLFLIQVVFGVFGALMGIFMMLFWMAVKIAIVGLVIYVIIRVISPDTAARLRGKFSGS